MISDDRILYADNHLLVVQKMPGELVQGDRTGDLCLADKAKAHIKERYAKPGEVYLGVVHRLDRPVGGVLLFARTSKAAARLSSAFQKRTLKKTYLALTQKWTGPDQGRLKHHLRKNAAQNKSHVVPEGTSGSKEAVLNYQCIHQLDRYSLLQVELETGRHHQIRAQLAAASAPIRGDLKYGARRSNPDGGIDLLAWRLELMHPVRKEPMCFQAALPGNWPQEIHRHMTAGS